MSEILDKPTILPVYQSNPFEDEFKSKWYERYKNGGCTKEHLQRLYNIDKLTEEDFKLITGELPGEKVIPQKSKVNELEDKISILTQQMEQQDEINASLTYDIMMLQEPISIATLINNHSPKYNLIKSWFNKGYRNEEMLLNAVEKHYITEEEMNEIIG